MEKTTLYLPSDLQARLRALAQRVHRPQAQLIREALDEYVDRHDAPWPRSIGSASSGRIPARDAKRWVRDEWDARVRERREG